MHDKQGARRTTVHDVARQAGVSLATVDRVLNDRPGVRPATAQKVTDAIRVLGFRRDLSASLLARARDLHIVFLIPDGRNEFMRHLAEAVAQRARGGGPDRLQIELHKVPPLDAGALAEALEALQPQHCDCVVIVATEDARVSRAVERLSRRGIAVMTLVSDLPGSARRLFIGTDNIAAGRTAASLMGRFCASGKIGLIAGSLGLRDHRERLEGFRAVAAAEFPQLELVGPLEGYDEDESTAAAAATLLSKHSDLCGIYNLGAGNAGLLRALDRSGRAGRVRVIAHELTEPTRRGLTDGAIDIVLDQNADGEIRAALDAAKDLVLGPGEEVRAEPIEIGIFLRDNLR